jgi:pyruvate carboxylase subunit B
MSTVTAPLPGRIIALKVQLGDKIGKEQALFVMEALKMENVIYSEEEGTVQKLFVRDGDDVETGDAVLEIA